MSSFLWRGGDNRRLFNQTPTQRKAYEERTYLGVPDTSNVPHLPKVLGIILIVVVIVVALIFLLL